MTAWQSILLGMVQGFTEFFPVSSSGHLVIFQQLLNIDQPGIIFDVFLHFCSLGAIIIFFYGDIIKLKWREIQLLIIGSIPASLVGVLFKSHLELAFSSIRLVAFTLMMTALINFVAQAILKTKKPGEKEVKNHVSNLDAFKVGLFQAIALLPGVSRSGSSILGSLFVGMKKEKAFSFAFLLAIPAILGASALEFVKMITQNSFNFPPIYLFGGIAALLSGLMSLTILRALISKTRLDIFGWYCLVVSLILISTQM